jgi:hypothetical protein
MPFFRATWERFLRPATINRSHSDPMKRLSVPAIALFIAVPLFAQSDQEGV